ncbi:MAG: thioredoxin family protein, partial [Proteobacteria bacterium]|nr:thioredoxin family protein [Pseudomonadota bacterium]
KIQWPTPTRFTAFDIDNFGYEDSATFPIDVTLQTPGKPITLNLKLDLLICNKLCVPESHYLSLTMPAGEAQVSPDQKTLALALKKIPATGDSTSFSIQDVWLAEEDNKKTYLHVNALSEHSFGAGTDLFVESSPFISVGKPVVNYDPPTQQLHLQAPVRSTEPLETLKQNLAQGTIVLTVTDSTQSFERRFVSASAAPPTHIATTVSNLAEENLNPDILLLAFLGGLILNLMPCVLPVLSLKILSVLSHGGKDHHVHRWTIFRNFMASAAGILCSFWIMAGALSLLKAGGQSLGWGVQFQNPLFLIFLIAVLIAFACNLWGAYEIPLPRFVARNLPARHEHDPTLLGHFLTGAFATLLATPCTAPFLGTAIGFALAREATDIFAVFTFLGLGLSFPYIVLALSPKIFKYMPKPGHWMAVLKKILAGALALTAVWLINVLITVSTQATLDDGWTNFDEALIKPAVEEGKTVIVDITADWCLTCKANKRLVIDQQDVEEALSGPNILRLQADWTQHNEAISAYMRKYGRYGVPFNIIYGPGAPNGIILSELLSKQEVMRALAEAADE